MGKTILGAYLLKSIQICNQAINKNNKNPNENIRVVKKKKVKVLMKKYYSKSKIFH